MQTPAVSVGGGGGGEACSVGCSVPDTLSPCGGAQGSLWGWLMSAAPTPPLLLLPAALGTHACASNGSWFWTLFAFRIGITGNIKCVNSWDHRLGPSCWGLCQPFFAGVPWPSFVCSHSKAEEAIDWELKWLKHHRTQTRASQACRAPKHVDKCVCV